MVDLEVRLQRAEAKVLAKGVLMDTCRVIRDQDGLADDLLDLASGALVPPAGDSTVLWTGAWALRPVGRGVDVALDARQHPDRPRDVHYEGLLPRSCPPLLTTDRIVCVTSHRDEQLVGREFRLASHAELTSFLVLRTVPLEVIG